MNTKNSLTDFVFIIPTLTNKRGLLDVLSLLDKFYSKKPIVIVNNDKSAALEKMVNLKKYKNSILVINNNKNTGFAKACNEGAKLAKKKINPNYFIFLNDDTFFYEDWVEKCIKEIRRKHWIATSPLILNTDGTIQNAGFTILPLGKVKLIKKINRLARIDGIPATALVIKSDIFLKMSGFDENFFAYLEDVDLCLRLKKKGYKFGITTKAQVYHEHMTTSSKMKPFKAYLDFRNWFLVIIKNWSREEIVSNFPAIFIERLRNLWAVVKSLAQL